MPATGAPTDGYHLEGERVIDRSTGEEHVCVAPGHPGTWVSTRGVGGGGTAITVFDEGVELGEFDEVDFAGTGVAATDAGGGRVLVTISAAALTTEQIEDIVGALIQDSSVLDVTYDDAGGAITITIKAGGVSNAMLADMAQSTFKGRAAAAGTGVPVNLTVAQVKTILALAAADISDFDTQVRTSRLDQLAVPTADVALGGKKITGLADPGAAQDAATQAYVLAQIAALVASAPGVLDTLDELAAALGDDANFAATIATALALKAPLASPTFTGVPAAPTAAQGTNTTQVATTAHVQTEAALLVAKSLIDAAGDLFVGTADNTVARLGKGSALDVLRVNAGATALEWAAPASASGFDLAQTMAFGG